jgi:L-lysine 2,3-aminomutase
VLLAGLNDPVDALADLSKFLFEHGAIRTPHVLNPVRGVAHFDVPNAGRCDSWPTSPHDYQ